MFYETIDNDDYSENKFYSLSFYEYRFDVAIVSRVLFTSLNHFNPRWTCDIQSQPVQLFQHEVNDFIVMQSTFVFKKCLHANAYFMNYLTNTRNVCTYLNVFLTVVTNMVMQFNNFDHFLHNLLILLTCRLHSPAAMLCLMNQTRICNRQMMFILNE